MQPSSEANGRRAGGGGGGGFYMVADTMSYKTWSEEEKEDVRGCWCYTEEGN